MFALLRISNARDLCPIHLLGADEPVAELGDGFTRTLGFKLTQLIGKASIRGLMHERWF